MFLVALGIILFIVSKQSMLIFTDDAQLIAVGSLYLRYNVFSWIPVAIGVSIARFIQGFGKGMPALVIIAVRTLLVSIPLSYIFVIVLNLQIHFVWISLVAASIVSAVLSLFYLRKTLTAYSSKPI